LRPTEVLFATQYDAVHSGARGAEFGRTALVRDEPEVADRSSTTMDVTNRHTWLASIN